MHGKLVHPFSRFCRFGCQQAQHRALMHQVRLHPDARESPPGTGNGFPRHQQAENLLSLPVHRQAGPQGDLDAVLGRQHPCVNHIRGKLSFGIIVGVAGIDSVLPLPETDHVF